MPVETMQTSNGNYAVDWSLVAEIIESYYRSRHAAETATVVSTSDREWYNPFSWQLPQIKTVEIDWDRCRIYAAIRASAEMQAYQSGFNGNAACVVSEVYQREVAIAFYRDQLRLLMQDAQSFNAASFESSQSGYETSIAITRFIRDLSAGGLVLGSTFVTGGAALAALGGGSVLTGVGKYQDTGSIGAGVLAGSGTAVLGAFSIGGKAASMAASQKYYLIIAKGVLETGTGLTAGDSVGDALLGGATKIVAEGAAKAIFDAKIVKDIFKNMPMPVKITATGGIRGRGFMTKSLGKEFIKGEAKSATSWIVKKSVSAATSAAYGPLVQATPIPSNSRTLMAFVKLAGDGRD